MITETTVMPTLFAEHLDTPIGTLVVLTDERDRVRVVDWTDFEPRVRRLLRLQYGRDGVALDARPAPSRALAALEAYFGGDLHALASVETASGGTVFQQTVWRTLRGIPAGQTRSYAELAAAIGRPTAVRAVGLANGANPIGIVVPCHRVIGASGALTGYGGGLERKRWLLEFEGAITPTLRNAPAADTPSR